MSIQEFIRNKHKSDIPQFIWCNYSPFPGIYHAYVLKLYQLYDHIGSLLILSIHSKAIPVSVNQYTN